MTGCGFWIRSKVKQFVSFEAMIEKKFHHRGTEIAQRATEFSL